MKTNNNSVFDIFAIKQQMAQIKFNEMNNQGFKNKRPRKPLAAIKVLGPHNYTKPQEKVVETLKTVDMGSLGSFVRDESGQVKFVDDPKGMWRVIHLPNATV